MAKKTKNIIPAASAANERQPVFFGEPESEPEPKPEPEPEPEPEPGSGPDVVSVIIMENQKL
jgi:hypothetical protein